MGILKRAYQAAKFIIYDIITDIRFLFYVIKRVSKNEPILRAEYKDELKRQFDQMQPIDWLKAVWPHLFLWAAFLVVGYSLGIKRGEALCNDHIMVTFYNATKYGSSFYIP